MLTACIMRIEPWCSRQSVRVSHTWGQKGMSARSARLTPQGNAASRHPRSRSLDPKHSMRLTDLHLILEDGNRLRVVQHEFIFFVFALRGFGGNLALHQRNRRATLQLPERGERSCSAPRRCSARAHRQAS